MVRLSEVLIRVADELRVFSRHVDSLEQAARERATNSVSPTNSSLTQAISNVYVDLVEFCQQVRQLLSGTSKDQWSTLLPQFKTDHNRTAP